MQWKNDSNLLISSNTNQTKAVVWSSAFHASLKIIYCGLLSVHINIPKFYHMQVLALSVDLSRDAEDVENTIEQVSFLSVFYLNDEIFNY